MKYTAQFDERTNVWRIVDLEHDSIKILHPDEDIPDGTPGMLVLDNLAVDALVSAVKKRFPGKFQVMQIGPRDENRKVKDLIVKLVAESPTTELLLVKTLVLESLMKKLQE